MHVFDFLRFSSTTATSGNVTGVLTRATFLARTPESDFQNVAVARDFMQNSYPHAKISKRLSIKHVQNVQITLKLPGAETLTFVEPKETTRTKLSA